MSGLQMLTLSEGIEGGRETETVDSDPTHVHHNCRCGIGGTMERRHCWLKRLMTH